MTSASAFSTRLLRRPGFEVATLRAVAAQPSFPKHTHDEFVISVNLAGAEWLWLDGRTHEADVGQVTAQNPGALQASGSLGRPGSAWSFVSLYVDPAFAADALGLGSPPTLPEPVLADPDTGRMLAGLGRLVSGPASDPGLADETAVTVLAAVARRNHRLGRIDAVDPPLRRAAELPMDRLGDPPDLATVAREAGLSREHLVRRFRGCFGLPPMAWALQKRLARARTLLRAGGMPGEVAAALGFADQAHLTRAFRASFGMTPGCYRRGR